MGYELDGPWIWMGYEAMSAKGNVACDRGVGISELASYFCSSGGPG